MGRESMPRQEASVAIVAPRFGTDFVGGAERSLRTIAKTLQRAGQRVEVFTTCTRHESDWSNELPPGTVQDAGLTIHRFPIDPHDRQRHLASLETLRRQQAPAAELEYLTHSLHAQALIEELKRRTAEFTAICPFSEFPDFAIIRLKYVPNERCIELKSLKLYINSFRNVKVFHEHVINIILEDFVKACDPLKVEIEGDFHVRGNIKTVVRASYAR